jgi:hypothetical protein
MKLQLDKKWKWAAMDAGGEWCIFEYEPKKYGNEWFHSTGECINIDGIVGDLPTTPWQDSLHRIINGELVKHVDLKVDDKVMVRNCGGDWHKRYYSHNNDAGRTYCYADGTTSWTHGNSGPVPWDEWRLPTPEELA